MCLRGINIAMGTTYGTILEAVPYSWDPSVVSLAMTGQIVVAIVAIPTLGNASDRIVKFFARRHRGVHEPEYRLVPLVFPIVVGIISSVIYGQAAQHPYVRCHIAILGLRLTTRDRLINGLPLYLVSQLTISPFWERIRHASRTHWTRTQRVQALFSSPFVPFVESCLLELRMPLRHSLTLRATVARLASMVH